MLTRTRIFLAVLLFPSAAALAQSNGLPASDILGSWDLWGNPTVIGGISNQGANAHGIW